MKFSLSVVPTSLQEGERSKLNKYSLLFLFLALYLSNLVLTLSLGIINNLSREMKTKYELYSDVQLTELLILEDKRAYEVIYNRYWPLLFSFARRKLGDDDQAKDIIQEVFVRLYERMGSLYNESVKSFLYKSVQNAIINAYKHTKVRSEYVASFKDYLDAGEFTTDYAVRENELKRQIEAEVNNLPPKMKAIFEMSRKQYMTHQQIADEIGIPEGTVRNTMTRALKILKSKLTCFLLLQAMTAILWLYKGR